MKILQVQQGSRAWHTERARRFTASEAPAMMGASKYTTRSQLLHQKATGITPEVTSTQQALFDKGHATEAAARAILERTVGELYPVTVVHDEDDRLLASVDGITIDDETLFEHKLHSDDLASQVASGELDPHYFWQLEHQLLVTGAERVIFVCSDGTEEKWAQLEYVPVPNRRAALLAGWAQFERDLVTYEPPAAAAPAAVAAPVEALPAVSVRMDGALAVVSNLDVFGAALRAFVQKIPAKPTSDQEFADCDAACKALKRAEEALDGAEANALGQVRSVEELTRTIADLRNVARTARLASEKMVKARKETIRLEEVQRGRAALAECIAGLNAAIGKPYMPQIAADFAGAIAGKKTLESLRNAIDTELARAKAQANEIANTIQTNMRTLRELASEHAFLFADTAQLVLKAPDDCRAQIEARIAAHKAEQERKLEAERARIRAEEEAKARAKAEQEQRDREAAERRQREEAEAAQRRQEQEAAALAEQQRRSDEAVRQALPAAAPVEDHSAGYVPLGAAPAAASATNVLPMPTKAPAGPPTLRLGELQKRIAPLSIDAAGLASLGFPHAKQEGAAKLYHEHQFPAIVDAMVAQLVRSKLDRQEAA